MNVAGATIGAVVIGRNEGARLLVSLASVAAQIAEVVYVDSGSTDDSVANARAMGIAVVELDPAKSFTAARARNAGFAWLRQRLPDLRFVQFVDGDCELAHDWLQPALTTLEGAPGAGVICGRRRERYPEVSPYNRLCDYEWDTPVGVAETCGGDALFRVAAFEDAGGFTDALIAGEEPDLCYRLRGEGWTVHRSAQEMTTHDAAMTRVGQWWQRNRRSGYATAEAFSLRGRGNHKMLRGVVSNIFWALPVAWPLWPVLWWRIGRRRGGLYATFTMLGKLPHFHGQIDYWARQRKLIEYK